MEEIPARRGSSDDGNLSKCTRYTLVQRISQIRRHHRSAAAISLAGASEFAFCPGHSCLLVQTNNATNGPWLQLLSGSKECRVAYGRRGWVRVRAYAIGRVQPSMTCAGEPRNQAR